MSKKRQDPTEQGKKTRQPTPTFLLELPLQVNESQAEGHRLAQCAVANKALMFGGTISVSVLLDSFWLSSSKWLLPVAAANSPAISSVYHSQYDVSFALTEKKPKKASRDS